MKKYGGWFIGFGLVGILLPPIGAIGILWTLCRWWAERRRQLNSVGLDLTVDPASGWPNLHRVDAEGIPRDVDRFGAPIDINDLPSL